MFSHEPVVALVSEDGQLAQFLQRHIRGTRVLAAPTYRRACALAIEYRATAILVDADPTGGHDEPAAPVPVVRAPLPHPGRAPPGRDPLPVSGWI